MVAAAPEDAVYTRCFDGGWPDAPHRALRNSTVTAWEAAGRPPAPHRPGEGAVVASDRHGRRHRRYGDMIPTPDMTGDVEAMAAIAAQAAQVLADLGRGAADGDRPLSE